MTTHWAAWAATACIVAMPVTGHPEQFTVKAGRPTVALEGRMFLLSEDGHVLRNGTVTPAGLALCAAMKMPSNRPCEWDTIIAASRDQTDPALWVTDVQTNTRQAAPESCLQPVLLETYSNGGEADYVYGCHVQHAFGEITPEIIERLAVAAKRLQSANPKTLAQHRAAVGLLSYTEILEKAAR